MTAGAGYDRACVHCRNARALGNPRGCRARAHYAPAPDELERLRRRASRALAALERMPRCRVCGDRLCKPRGMTCD
jgi:hypothetical protein